MHRDVKPANIMVADLDTDDPSIFLADFGIARPLDDTSGLTATNMTVGTVAYAAPEQLMGESIDGRADEYALAATTYNLLTGSQLFPNSNPAVVISHHLNTTPPSLGDSRPDLAELDPVLRSALAKSPDDRYPSCTAFACALTDELPASRAVSSSAATQAAPQPSRSSVRADPALADEQPPNESGTGGSRRNWMLPAAAATTVLLLALVALAWRSWDLHKSSSASTSTLSTSTPTSSSTSASNPPPTVPSTAQSPSTNTLPPDPALSGPVTGSSCNQQQWNNTAVSREGKSVRCMRGEGGYTWQTDFGEQIDPAVIAQIGWQACNARYTPATCVAAAQQIVGAPSSSVPVTPDGTWAVPSWMKYGDYAAAVGPSGTCYWYGYDSGGRIVDSGHYDSSADKPTAEVNPFMTTFQTAGCTPWVMIRPLSPDW